MTDRIRDFLRSLPSLAGVGPALDLDSLPRDPVQLFIEWLEGAVRAGVAEPHAMTLSTVDESGAPDARILLLKDVDERGWAFAGTASSGKGHQLRACPRASLTFWWQPLVRSVRLRGTVIEASRSDSLADLRARSVEAQEGVDPDDWTVWRLVPTRAEFWQGSTDRRHTRIVFVPDGQNWRVAP
ncbi:pyridoxamine 5'-phosphate oxidase family protein [Mycobacterium sp. MYCO198283]|uniref:pyridoxine/pyridoxamine 5'-phosphate oxidase n=1 Tax=Mycobacterium sp. MYCO198283 TaxID=2883505 RepID=UPI001E2B47EF|nr:pyridoxamine 5'-phosphate oxidase family protein [Mycobacterium sp. MYCO198283]MCG5430846.1 pyridoxamine 5'-phosphate oxidase family protein [Mycobacterium sp. MYCO198283]